MEACTISRVLILTFCCFVFAQPPANDLCNNAVVIPSSLSSPFTFSGTTVGSAKENTCPGPTSRSGDVWFSVRPEENMLVDISLCGSSFDTALYLNSGSCSSVQCLAANDDSSSCGTKSVLRAQTMFQGQTYFIVVAGFDSEVGGYTLTVSRVESGCASATAITSLPYTSNPLDLSSSFSYNTPCTTGASAWFTYTPASNIVVRISTCTSAASDTFISVATGTCPSALTCIASNADAPAGTCNPLATSTKAFLGNLALTAGTTYYFAASLSGSATGTITVSVANNPAENDLCVNAIPIPLTALPYSHTGTTVSSSRDSTCRGVLGYTLSAGDVWYSITPTDDVVVDVSLCRSLYDVYLNIASGSCSSLTCLATNDDSSLCTSSSTGSIVRGMPMARDRTYFIIVSGYGTNTGTYTLDVSVSAGTSGCTTANAISNLPFTSASIPLSATTAAPCIAGRGVWFTYTPSADISVTIDSCSSSFSPVLSISSGTCQFGLSCVNDATAGRCSLTNMVLTANVQYFITAATSSANEGVGNVVLSMTGNSVNDQCSQATVIASLPFTTSSSTSFAAQDFSCVTQSSPVVSSGPDVWYTFTPSTSYASVTISTCSSLSQFGVYVSSGSCNNGECVQSDSTSCPGGTSGLLEIPMQAATQYFIAVSSLSASSAFTLTINVPPSVPISIRCPSDVSKVANRSTCKYSGSTGTPLIASASGPASVSKSPQPPYSIGVTEVRYTVTANSDADISASCVQLVTVTKPTGNYCNN